jgi:hypothetical protein
MAVPHNADTSACNTADALAIDEAACASILAGVDVTPVLLTAGKAENSLSSGHLGIHRRTIITGLIRIFHRRTLRSSPGIAHFSVFITDLLELGRLSNDFVIAVGLDGCAAVRAGPKRLPVAPKHKHKFNVKASPLVEFRAGPSVQEWPRVFSPAVGRLAPVSSHRLSACRVDTVPALRRAWGRNPGVAEPAPWRKSETSILRFEP